MPEKLSEGKSRRSAEAARQAILAAAEEHFARYGFSGARIEAIAETAGYNKSLIFHYFTDKLGLYQEVVRCVKKDQDRMAGFAFLSIIEDETVPITRDLVRDFIAVAVGSAFDRMRTNDHLRRIFAWEAAEGWQTYAQVNLGQGMLAYHSAAARFMRRAQAAGIIRPEVDPLVLMTLIMGATLAHLSSLPRYALMFPEADFTSDSALERARDQLVQLVLHGTLQSSSEAEHHHGI